MVREINEVRTLSWQGNKLNSMDCVWKWVLLKIVKNQVIILYVWVYVYFKRLIQNLVTQYLYFLSNFYRGGSSNLKKGGFHLMKTSMCKIHHLSINKDFLNVFHADTTVFNKHLSHHYLFHIYFNSRVHCIIERFAVLV